MPIDFVHAYPSGSFGAALVGPCQRGSRRHVRLEQAGDLEGGGCVHVLMVNLKIDPGRAQDALNLLHRFVLPTIKQGAGFVNGTWMRSEDGTRGVSVLM